MNENPHDHPDLTAYALGELTAEHAEAMAQWIARNPQARGEAEITGQLAQTLAATAPVSQHALLPHQRAAVLAGPQRVRQMVAAAAQPRQRQTTAMSAIWGIARLAAAAAIAITGYIAGAHFSKQSTVTVVAAPPAEPVRDTQPEAKPVPFKAKELPQPVIAEAPAPVEAPKPAVITAPEPQAVVVVAKVPELPAPAPQPKVVAQAKTQVMSQPFVSTSKVTLAQVSLRPSITRPVLAKAASGGVAAAPMTAVAKAAPRPAKQPDLMIHSWKADVASCPWDDTHRLVRLVVQMPGEQPAATSAANTYPLQMNFSPTAVRSFRQLAERTLPAQEADSPAFHIAWYEIVPNGTVADGTPKTIGDILLPNMHFTTPAMAIFDSTRLQVQDRGTNWQNAGEDFQFESAVVGFGLLMKGEKDTGDLNHSLVLDLAQRAKDDDRTGERAKFIKLVQDAQKVAGLK